MATYFTLLTAIGQAKIANAIALGDHVEWTNMAVGDGNGNPTTPSETQTALVRERYRAPINQLTVDPDNPNYMISELIVPTDVGGWTVYEVGIFDADDDLVAVANFPATYKPELAEGSGRDLVVRIIIQVSNSSVVELKIDPAIVLASRKWVVDNFSVAALLPGGTTHQVLRKHSNADGDTEWADPLAAIQVIVSSREESQTLAADQVIVDLAIVTTQGCAVYIEGVRLEESEFDRTTSTRITLDNSYPAGTKITVVQNEEVGNLATPPRFDNDTSLATSEFVRRQGVQSSGASVVTTGGALSTTHAGGTVVGNSVSNHTQTLPPASTFPAGARIQFLNINTGAMTVARASTDTIAVSNTAVTSLALGNGDTLTLESNGINGWRALDGSVQLGYSLAFGAQRAASGYQRLPGGLILQWGNNTTVSGSRTDISFPIPFPTACVGVFPTITGANTSGIWAAIETGGIGNTGFNAYSAAFGTAAGGAANGNIGFYWFALGY